VSQAFVIAVGVTADRCWQVLGFDLGVSGYEHLWTTFLRSLTNRGLDDVGLAISHAHTGLKEPEGPYYELRAGGVARSTSSPT